MIEVTGIRNIFSTVVLTIGAQTSAFAPSLSAFTAAIIASSIEVAEYSLIVGMQTGIQAFCQHPSRRGGSCLTADNKTWAGAEDGQFASGSTIGGAIRQRPASGAPRAQPGVIRHMTAVRVDSQADICNLSGPFSKSRARPKAYSRASGNVVDAWLKENKP